MAEIEWTRKAIKQLAKIDSVQRVIIINAIKSLAHYQAALHVKKLTQHIYGYRLRVGRYRVLFDVINDKVEIVMIQEVRKRDESTY